MTWCISILLLLAAAAGLAAGLYFTVPCAKQLTVCNPAANGKPCWDAFWQCTKSGNAPGLFFFLACAGAGCLLLSLLTCCCFCCQKSPGAKKRKQQGQFMASSGGDAPAVAGTTSTGDTVVYPDQYAAYDSAAPVGYKGSSGVAHV